MAVTTTQVDGGADTMRTPSTLVVGVVVWLASELMFFAGLFAAYFTLRSINRPWPPDDVELETVRMGFATGALVCSSVTTHLAVAIAKQGDRYGAVRWLSLTFLLQAVFLVNLVLEWFGAGFRWHDHAYGSIFYLLTGFHGLHVLGGLALVVAISAATLGGSRAPGVPIVEVTGQYLYFVDAVGVALFLIIYVLR